MTLKFTGREIRVDLYDAAQEMEEHECAALFDAMAVHPAVARRVVDMLCDGYTEDSSHPGDHVMDPLRRQLADGRLTDAVAELVQDLTNELAQAKATHQRDRDWAWRLWHAWPKESIRQRPDTPDFVRGEWVTKEEARAALPEPEEA